MEGPAPYSVRIHDHIIRFMLCCFCFLCDGNGIYSVTSMVEFAAKITFNAISLPLLYVVDVVRVILAYKGLVVHYFGFV